VLPSLGRYQVDQLLARGGMGEVYLGRVTGAHDFARPVVLKVIRSELVDDERVAMMFVDEARIAAGLHHRNIVQVIDFDVFDGGAFLVTEHVSGCDLGDLLDYTVPAFGVAAAVICELATGLGAAHDACDVNGAPLQLVHRDVSPSNVLISDHGEVKLADFGIAKARSRSYHTMSGTIKGKPSYMAPEQILGEPLDRRADIFALGVLLFELSTASPLYSEHEAAIAMQRILDGAAPDPGERRAGYPPALTAIVGRAIARKREDRYQTARALADDLEALARAERWPWATSSADIAALVARAKVAKKGAVG
jgi:serine/threonine-protein kinase